MYKFSYVNLDNMQTYIPIRMIYKFVYIFIQIHIYGLRYYNYVYTNLFKNVCEFI
jgi:hypothetical protein